jgi:hypothetical protein
MSLWTRFVARRKARKAERQAIAAIKQQNRVEAEANLRRALALGGDAHVSIDHVSGGYESSHHYHGSIGTDCGPNVSGNCTGTGI